MLTEFRERLQAAAESIQFDEVMALIDKLYDYTPTEFTNGLGDAILINKAGQNEGSCQLFAFAKDQNLSVAQTLQCFGDYYRQDVLSQPEGENHMNIRQFMQYGWEGITFKSNPLSAKTT